MMRNPAKPRTVVSVVVGALVACFGVAGMATTQAYASLPNNPPPVQQRNALTVSDTPLPTVQIDNGVVWSQAIVGTTVYAGGSFSNARPAGAARGTNLTPRSNLLAYDITTGRLISTFAPSLNGQVKVVRASPDGTRLYVGGSFTTAGGATHSKIAAIST